MLENATMMAPKKPRAKINSVKLIEKNIPENTGTKREADEATLMVRNLQVLQRLKETNHLHQQDDCTTSVA